MVSVLVFVFNNLKKHAYSNFIEEYLQLSEPIDGDENPVSGYDLILVGSDQVWNPKQTDGFDKMYWGDFKHDGVLASWAASFRENAFEKKAKNFRGRFRCCRSRAASGKKGRF